MSLIVIEDCLRSPLISNKFELVLLASQRVKEIYATSDNVSSFTEHKQELVLSKTDIDNGKDLTLNEDKQFSAKEDSSTTCGTINPDPLSSSTDVDTESVWNNQDSSKWVDPLQSGDALSSDIDT